MTALLVICALIVLGAEFGARIWLRWFARTYPWKPHIRFEMEPDPAILPQLTRHTTFKANSLGIRGRDVPATDGIVRIVTCGGSAVECFSLDETEAWPALVEKELSQPHAKAQLGVDDVHVLNLAKSGFTNEALGYLLPRVLDRVGPIDILTITTGTSAVNAWTKAGTPPIPRPPGHPWDDVHWHSEGTWGWHPAGTAIAEVVRRVQHVLFRPVVTMRKTGAGLAAGRYARTHAVETRDVYPDPAAWIADYEASLEDLVRCARRYARQVVLLRQSWFDLPEPTAEDFAGFWHGFVGDAPPSKRKIFYSYHAFNALMAHTDAANIRVADRMGIKAVALADAVEASRDIYYDQIHFTPAGARKVADFVAPVLFALLSETATDKSAEVAPQLPVPV